MMKLQIKTIDYIEAIKQLRKLAPKGKGRTKYLNGVMSLSFSQNEMTLTVEDATQMCDAKGIWVGTVLLSFEFAQRFALVPPNIEYINVRFYDGVIHMENMGIVARLEI
jgi:hypothetical protein